MRCNGNVIYCLGWRREDYRSALGKATSNAGKVHDDNLIVTKL